MKEMEFGKVLKNLRMSTKEKLFDICFGPKSQLGNFKINDSKRLGTEISLRELFERHYGISYELLKRKVLKG